MRYDAEPSCIIGCIDELLWWERVGDDAVEIQPEEVVMKGSNLLVDQGQHAINVPLVCTTVERVVVGDDDPLDTRLACRTGDVWD
jgi:hypothetical protein